MFREFSQKSDLLERHTPVLPYTASTPPPPPGCIILGRSIEKKGKRFWAVRGIEPPDFRSTAQCFTNVATNKALRNMVYLRNKPIH